MSRIPDEYEPLLSRVERPGRYVGGELNAVCRDPATLEATVALAFPDLYDLGMSHHGLRILYEIVNDCPEYAAERVFTPWADYAEALREARLPLTTLETFRPLSQLEIVGFTLQNELAATNVLETLDLGGVPVLASDRSDPFPLVIAGGEGAFSPEPMAQFIDAFVVGDGEEVVLDIMRLAAEGKRRKLARQTLLERLAGIRGVYVPSLYEVHAREDRTIDRIVPRSPKAPTAVAPLRVELDRFPAPRRPLAPLIRTVQDRTVVEVRRGCVHGCRFCQSGMITRPARERPVEQVLELARCGLDATGDRQVSFLSLSTADYTRILPLVRRFNAEFASRRISVSLPSLRISAFDVELAREVSAVRKSGFTFAPEAGSERLRRIINKPLDEKEFLDVVRRVVEAGWQTLKFYFMVGLPGETDEDLEGIARLVHDVLSASRDAGRRKLQINVTLSPFVPKAHTPFQWEAQPPLEELRRRIGYVRDRLPRDGRRVSVKSSPLEASFLEAVLARGDRRLGDAIFKAWQLGCRFDAWSETFRYDLWQQAFEAVGIDPAWYANRPRETGERFPFEVIESPPGRAFLEKERDRARQSLETPECQDGPCSGCAACASPKEHRLARELEDDRDVTEAVPAPPRAASRQPGPKSEPPPPVMRVRLRFSKTDSLRFVAHLDLAEAIHRIMRLSEAPLAYSQGFNPQPRISLSPPLPLGFEGLGELVDVCLTRRIDLQAWLRRLRELRLEGLQWVAAGEVSLKAPAIQQALQFYEYLVGWQPAGESASALPLDHSDLEDAIGSFMNATERIVELERKGGLQRRDARAFVTAFEMVPAPPPCTAAVRLAIRSENGRTLSPLVILGNVAGGAPEQGVHLRVARLPLQIPEHAGS